MTISHLPRHLQDVFKKSSRHPQDVFKTFLRRLHDVLEIKKTFAWVTLDKCKDNT